MPICNLSKWHSTNRVIEHDSSVYILYFYSWDTAGAERFKGVTTAYFRGAHGQLY